MVSNISAELTDKQLIFIAVFCESMEQGLPKREALKIAKEAAGYASTTSTTDILTPKVTETIIAEQNKRLVLLAVRAVSKVEDVLDEPESKGAANALAAAFGVLDRVGLTKKESQSITVTTPSAIVILPPKAPLGTEPTAV